MEEIARVYAEALFDVAKEKDRLDEIREQLEQFADAVHDDRDLQTFLFSPYFSSAEKRDGMDRAVSGADEELVNFIGLLAEKHRMPAIFRIRQTFEELYAEENKQLDVNVTSAIELNKDVIKQVGDEIDFASFFPAPIAEADRMIERRVKNVCAGTRARRSDSAACSNRVVLPIWRAPERRTARGAGGLFSQVSSSRKAARRHLGKSAIASSLHQGLNWARTAISSSLDTRMRGILPNQRH